MKRFGVWELFPDMEFFKTLFAGFQKKRGRRNLAETSPKHRRKNLCAVGFLQICSTGTKKKINTHMSVYILYPTNRFIAKRDSKHLTWLGSPRNFAKTRFRRFRTFRFSTPKKFCRRKFWIKILVFCLFGMFFGELQPKGPQNQLPRQILL